MISGIILATTIGMFVGGLAGYVAGIESQPYRKGRWVLCWDAYRRQWVWVRFNNP